MTDPTPDPLAGLRPQPYTLNRATMLAAIRDMIAEAERDPDTALLAFSAAPDGLCRMTGLADLTDMLRVAGTVLDRCQKVMAANGDTEHAQVIAAAMRILSLRSTPL